MYAHHLKQLHMEVYILHPSFFIEEKNIHFLLFRLTKQSLETSSYYFLFSSYVPGSHVKSHEKFMISTNYSYHCCDKIQSVCV